MEPEHIGPYRIDTCLGWGGMGAVYRAWDERLDRWVALKSLHPDRRLSAERRERLRREARAAARLNHTAIAQVYDIVHANDLDWIVMEYVEGRSVAALLLDGPMEPDQAVDIARQIAEGLAAAHEAGIVHRDLKAENVLVKPGGQVKILDFGLAKRVDPSRDEDSLTKDGVVMGTSRAMSPEQAQGRPVDHRSDLFSLGSLLYEMTTGRHPFQGSGPLDTMQRVVHHRPPAADRVSRSLPQPLVLLVEQLLEKDPRARPQSALEVAVALSALTELWRTGTSDQTSLSRITGSARRRRLWRRRWLIAGVLAAAVVLGGTLHLVLQRPPPPLYVAVPSPTVSGTNPPPVSGLTARAVRTALLNGLGALSGLVVVDPGSVDRVSGGPRAIARAVAADEVMTASVEPGAVSCRVTLRRLRGRDAALLWTDELQVPNREDSSLLITQAITSRLSAAYPGRSWRGSAPAPTASAADMTEYLQLSAALDDPTSGLSRSDILDRLTTLRQRAPRFVEAGALEATVARYLYQMQHDPRFLKRAFAALRQAREAAPDDPHVIRAVFEVELAAGELDAAAAANAHLAAVRPDSPDVLENRAALASHAGRPQEALAILGELVQLRPTWLNLLRLSDSELAAGQVTDARRDLDQALGLAPDNYYVLGKLAQLELTAGDPSRAADLYSRLVAGNPGSVQWLANLATCEMLLGRYEQAREHFRTVLERVPNNPAILLSLADTVALAGDANGADALYRQVVNASDAATKDPEVLGSRAQALAHLGAREEAVATVQQELRLKPDDPFHAYSAALVYALAGEQTSAVVQARRALELGLNPRWLDLPWFDPVRAELDAALTPGAAGGSN